jgi:TolB protein
MKTIVRALALLLVLVTPASADPPKFPGELKLSYTAQIDGQDDLYVVDLSNGKIRRITNHRAKDSHGVPSPDGRSISFSSERVGWWKIWIAASDGTSARQLTDPQTGADYHPDWSPDGKKIAYVKGAAGNGDILVMNADGTEAKNISRNEGKDNFPTWSPDGRWIAFASDRDGTWRIYVTDPDGNNTKRVSGEREAIEPSWYPDSKRLVYQAVEGDAFNLFSVSIEGSPTPKRLTDHKADEKRPVVSSSGDWIAFESDRAGGSHLFVMPAAGGKAERVTDRGFNYAPHWWPLADRAESRE